MKLYEFKQRFKAGIRPQLNWDRFQQENWRIQVRILELSREAEHIFAPWHVDENGIPCVHDHKSANQLNLWDAIQNKKVVENFKLRANSEVPSYMFPGYALPNSQVLLLDGNHRLSGHLIARRDIVVEVATIVGPIEESALLDLRYWE